MHIITCKGVIKILIAGDTISKIYKAKDKLVVYLPFDMIKYLGLKEGDEIDFFKHPDSDKYFIVAKKSDIADLIMQQKQQQPPARPQQQAPQAVSGPNVTNDELAVLKKLDTIRYNDRTKEKLKQALNQGERKILVGLIKRKLVSPFKKAGEQTFKYGIAKSVYNKYLLGKREPREKQQPQKAVTVQIQIPQIRIPERILQAQPAGGGTSTLEMLEQNGFLVVANQTEASAISAELEASIRSGQVIGTRAFNRKYYITMKSFVSKNAQKIMKAIGTKTTSVADISKATGIDEEGCRAILYIMAENGDITESKRDTFRVV